MNTKVYIGLDVHKNSIAAAYALADGSPPQNYATWRGSNLSDERGLLKLMKKLRVRKGELRICYTAAAERHPPAKPDRRD